MNKPEAFGSGAADADWKFRQNASWFARPGYVIHGALTAALLVRVAEGGDTEVRQMQGAVRGLDNKSTGRPGFVVSAEGTVGLSCQSCGATFDLPVDSQSTIYVARDAAELASWEEMESEAFESIEASEKTSALELVEDELLLSIPYVPRCPKCEADETPRTHEFG